MKAVQYVTAHNLTCIRASPIILPDRLRDSRGRLPVWPRVAQRFLDTCDHGAGNSSDALILFEHEQLLHFF